MSTPQFVCDFCRTQVERGWNVQGQFVCPICNDEDQAIRTMKAHIVWLEERRDEARATRSLLARLHLTPDKNGPDTRVPPTGKPTEGEAR